MRLLLQRLRLRLRHPWRIARTLNSENEEEHQSQVNVVAELTDDAGVNGLGEAAPTRRYGETVESVEQALRRVDLQRVSFRNLQSSLRYLEEVLANEPAARCVLDLALHDGAARVAGQSVYDYLGLGFREATHRTSFSIGIDDPAKVGAKAVDAAAFPILKLKLGGVCDRENVAAVRAVAPDKPLRVDANEAWRTKEEALDNLRWLAGVSRLEFVEQPMPASTSLADLAWLKSRSPVPLMADESYLRTADLAACRQGFHAVNVKLVKAGGLDQAAEALRAAREAGLKTMLGCMIESSIGISAAAHLAELTDYLDLDGSLLIMKDAYEGVTAVKGVVSFAEAVESTGLRVRSRAAR
jgi:L-alanine-DL-glutamate epimerase-like enolase superfamily enzyme